MIIDENIRDEKLKCIIYGEAATTSAISPRKIGKYKILYAK